MSKRKKKSGGWPYPRYPREDEPPTPESKVDPLQPSLALLSKLGSIAVHVQEGLSAKGHPFDIEALKPLLADPEVNSWIKQMGVYMPRKR